MEDAMGTVGLSYGSPTSGDGFDVSSTVASIVSNLRNVETPWKNRLTKLESQDTAISSLGSLMSSLSNDMSSLTDFDGILSTKTGSSSNTNVLELTSASTSAVAGTHTVEVKNLAKTSSGYLAEVDSASDTLSGSITLQAASGKAQTFDIDSLSDKTLTGLASAINSSGVGINASVLTDSSGSRLSLVSSTSGANGNISVSDNSITDKTTSSDTLAYKSTVDGKDANLTVDGIDLTSTSNTVTDLIPGLTFQLLAPTTDGEQVQVVIGNDNSDIETAINSMVNDYNSLVSAMNAQEGQDSSGNNEPLYGSSTLSLLQQQLLGSLNKQNPNGYLDAITNSSDTLSGSISISLAGGLSLGYSGTSGTDASGDTAAQTSTGTLSAIDNTSDTLSGSITIQVGSGTSQTITLDSSDNTLSGLMDAINNTSGIGVTASIVTKSDGSSSLSLSSGTSGSDGTLSVTSNIVDTSTQTIDVPTSSGDNTIYGLASAINSAHAGVTASVVTNSSGSHLELVSNKTGTAGALTVTSSITDTTTSKALDYNSEESDINNLTTLGISVNNDGSLSFDSSSLDSVLNTDFSSVVGFFQNSNSWGQSFSTTLTNAGTSSSKGILKLALNSNSSIESSLNSDISREETLISSQEASLTSELNSANEIMQAIPSKLDEINQLYSAITGYDSSSS
jgi:flagellar hook-associated protein 2